jgi:mRNA interferase RelE/StbE
LREARELSGNVRQRVKRAIGGLANDPRPAGSKALDMPEVAAQVRRLRLDQWRIVYAVTDADRAVDVLAVRKRPPYDYGDLQALIADSLPPREQ